MRMRFAEVFWSWRPRRCIWFRNAALGLNGTIFPWPHLTGFVLYGDHEDTRRRPRPRGIRVQGVPTGEKPQDAWPREKKILTETRERNGFCAGPGANPPNRAGHEPVCSGPPGRGRNRVCDTVLLFR